MLQKMQK